MRYKEERSKNLNYRLNIEIPFFAIRNFNTRYEELLCK